MSRWDSPERRERDNRDRDRDRSERDRRDSRATSSSSSSSRDDRDHSSRERERGSAGGRHDEAEDGRGRGLGGGRPREDDRRRDDRPPAVRRGKRHRPEEEEDESKYEWGKQEAAADSAGDGRRGHGGEGGRGRGGEADGEEGGDGDKKKKAKKVKPNMERSGKLQEEAMKTEEGVVLKFADPPEAKRPKKKWRLYPFKGDQPLEVIPVYHKASYLFGRDRAVANIPTDHISCSKQHAVLVHREVNVPDELGIGPGKMVLRPYIIDLESANGTFLNGKRLEASRYYELKPKDVLKFGQSSREYVVLHDELAKGS